MEKKINKILYFSNNINNIKHSINVLEKLIKIYKKSVAFDVINCISDSYYYLSRKTYDMIIIYNIKEYEKKILNEIIKWCNYEQPIEFNGEFSMDFFFKFIINELENNNNNNAILLKQITLFNILNEYDELPKTECYKCKNFFNQLLIRNN